MVPFVLIAGFAKQATFLMAALAGYALILLVNAAMTGVRMLAGMS